MAADSTVPSFALAVIVTLPVKLLAGVKVRVTPEIEVVKLVESEEPVIEEPVEAEDNEEVIALDITDESEDNEDFFTDGGAVEDNLSETINELSRKIEDRESDDVVDLSNLEDTSLEVADEESDIKEVSDDEFVVSLSDFDEDEEIILK